VFYHRPPRGFGYARQAMVAPVKIEWDKKPVSKGGQVRITGYDPFVKNNEWVAAATDGNTYTGAEVTSEGFNIFGLPPYAYYSAGIACYMDGPNANNYMQDNHDVWNNSMDLAGLQNGSIIGFKYFNFEGLANDAKGVKAFRGISKDDTPFLKLRLTIEGGNLGDFKIRVMLDNPSSGRELDVINFTSKEQPETKVEIRQLKNETRDLLASLKGNHAIPSSRNVQRASLPFMASDSIVTCLIHQTFPLCPRLPSSLMARVSESLSNPSWQPIRTAIPRPITINSMLR